MEHQGLQTDILAVFEQRLMLCRRTIQLQNVSLKDWVFFPKDAPFSIDGEPRSSAEALVQSIYWCDFGSFCIPFIDQVLDDPAMVALEPEKALCRVLLEATNVSRRIQRWRVQPNFGALFEG